MEARIAAINPNLLLLMEISAYSEIFKLNKMMHKISIIYMILYLVIDPNTIIGLTLI